MINFFSLVFTPPITYYNKHRRHQASSKSTGATMSTDGLNSAASASLSAPFTFGNQHNVSFPSCSITAVALVAAAEAANIIGPIKQKECFNCHQTETCQWRSGYGSDVLCNTCFVFYMKHSVYRNPSDEELALNFSRAQASFQETVAVTTAIASEISNTYETIESYPITPNLYKLLQPNRGFIDNRPKSSFVCFECGKAFDYYSHLTSHLKHHDDPRRVFIIHYNAYKASISPESPFYFGDVYASSSPSLTSGNALLTTNSNGSGSTSSSSSSSSSSTAEPIYLPPGAFETTPAQMKKRLDYLRQGLAPNFEDRDFSGSDRLSTRQRKNQAVAATKAALAAAAAAGTTPTALTPTLPTTPATVADPSHYPFLFPSTFASSGTLAPRTKIKLFASTVPKCSQCDNETSATWRLGENNTFICDDCGVAYFNWGEMHSLPPTSTSYDIVGEAELNPELATGSNVNGNDINDKDNTDKGKDKEKTESSLRVNSHKKLKLSRKFEPGSEKDDATARTILETVFHVSELCTDFERPRWENDTSNVYLLKLSNYSQPFEVSKAPTPVSNPRLHLSADGSLVLPDHQMRE